MSTTLTVDLASAVARNRRLEASHAIAVQHLAKGRRQRRAATRRLRLIRLAVS
jgi:hypothetical protein